MSCSLRVIVAELVDLTSGGEPLGYYGIAHRAWIRWGERVSGKLFKGRGP